MRCWFWLFCSNFIIRLFQATACSQKSLTTILLANLYDRFWIFMNLDGFNLQSANMALLGIQNVFFSKEKLPQRLSARLSFYLGFMLNKQLDLQNMCTYFLEILIFILAAHLKTLWLALLLSFQQCLKQLGSLWPFGPLKPSTHSAHEWSGAFVQNNVGGLWTTKFHLTYMINQLLYKCHEFCHSQCYQKISFNCCFIHAYHEMVSKNICSQSKLELYLIQWFHFKL